MQAAVSTAAGEAADAWALVEALEGQGDAAGAALGAAQAVALQQQFQEKLAGADAAAGQAQQQVRALHSTADLLLGKGFGRGLGRHLVSRRPRRQDLVVVTWVPPRPSLSPSVLSALPSCICMQGDT